MTYICPLNLLAIRGEKLKLLKQCFKRILNFKCMKRNIQLGIPLTPIKFKFISKWDLQFCNFFEVFVDSRTNFDFVKQVAEFVIPMSMSVLIYVLFNFKSFLFYLHFSIFCLSVVISVIFLSKSVMLFYGC